MESSGWQKPGSLHVCLFEGAPQTDCSMCTACVSWLKCSEKHHKPVETAVHLHLIKQVCLSMALTESDGAGKKRRLQRHASATSAASSAVSGASQGEASAASPSITEIPQPHDANTEVVSKCKEGCSMVFATVIPGEMVKLSARSRLVQQRDFLVLGDFMEDRVKKRTITIDLEPGFVVTNTNCVMATDGSGTHKSIELTMTPVGRLGDTDSDDNDDLADDASEQFEAGSLCTPTPPAPVDATEPTTDTQLGPVPAEIHSPHIMDWLSQQALTLDDSQVVPEVEDSQMDE